MIIQLLCWFRDCNHVYYAICNYILEIKALCIIRDVKNFPPESSVEGVKLVQPVCESVCLLPWFVSALTAESINISCNTCMYAMGTVRSVGQEILPGGGGLFPDFCMGVCHFGI